MADLNWIAIIAGTVAMFLFGWLWYGPLFSKPWMVARGLDPEECKDKKMDGMGKMLGINLFLTFIAAIVMAHVLSTYGNPALDVALMIGGGIGFGFVATSLGTAYAYTQQKLSLWFIDGGFWTLGFALMAGVESALS